MRNDCALSSTRTRYRALALGLTLAVLSGGPAFAQSGVGIGTTAPDASAALDIVSSTKGALLPRVVAATAIATPATGLLVFQTGAPAGFYYNAGTPGAPNWQQIATAAGAAVTASNGLTKTGSDVALGGALTADTDVGLAGRNLTFSGAGNVGIGTGTPVTRLTISPATVEPKIALYNGAGVVNYYGLGISGFQLNYHTGSNAGNHVFYAGGTNGDGTELLRIRSNGNVGIGTAAPTQKLEVAGQVFSSSGGFRFPDNTVQTTAAAGDNLGNHAATQDLGLNVYDLRLRAATDAVHGLGYYGTVNANKPWNGVNVDGPVLYGYAGGVLGISNGAQQSVLTWNSAGRVGIGTGTPTQRLDVAGNAVVSGNVGIGNTAPAQRLDVTGNAVVSGNVGIGNTSPGAKLHLSGNLRADLANGSFNLHNFPAASNETVLLGTFSGTNNNAAQLRFGNVGSTYMDIGQDSSGAFVVEGNDATRLTVQRAGNVGIGTGTPTQKLQVAGQVFSSSGGFRFPDNTVQTTAAVTATAANFIQNQTTADQTGGFRISGNGLVGGRLGVGTPTPGGRLHLVNDGGGSGAADDYLIDEYGPGDQALYLRRANGTAAAPLSLAANDYIGGLTFVPRINSGLSFFGSSVRSYYAGDGTNLLTDMRLLTSNAERVRISSSGNVGIGNAAPAQKLDVTGNAVVSGNVGIGNVAPVQKLDVTGNAVVSGNVGIGNTAPTAKLHVSGNLRADMTNGSFTLNNFGPTSAETVLLGIFSGTNNNAAQLRFGNVGSTYMDIGQDSSGAFVVEGNDATRLTVQRAGRVGIGTSTPLAKLDVQGGADNTGANDPVALAFSWRSGGYRHFVRSRHNSSVTGAGNNLDFYLNNSPTAAGSSSPGVGNVQVLTLESNNGQPRVGIGTTAPTQALQVAGQVFSSTGGFRFPDNTVQTTAAVTPAALTASNGLTRTGNDVALGGTLSGATSIATGGFNLNLTGTGRLGIGTATPRGQLDAAGTGDIYLVNSPNVGTAQSLYLPGHLYLAPYNGSNVAYLQARRADNSGTSALQLRTYNNGTLTEALHLAGNGNVGIGTTTPTQKLDVTGGIRFTGAGSVLTFPDGTTQATAATGGADNLGNHTATQNLNLAGNALVGTGANIGATVGVGIRADGGLNLGQNGVGHNLYLGFQAGLNTVPNNVAMPNEGTLNQFVGYQSGATNTTGRQNVFSGYQSGFGNTTGSNNVFGGLQSGYGNTTGSNNVFSGVQSGYTNSTGFQNVFAGLQSGFGNSTGSNNVFSGTRAGYENTTGSNNTAVGFNSGPAAGSGAITNATAVGANVSLTQSNTVVLGNGAKVGIGTATPATTLDVNGNLRLTVRLCPVNIATPGAVYFMSASDVAFSIFKVAAGGYVSGLQLPPPAAGQVEGQELTILNTSTTGSVTIAGTDSDNTAAVVLATAGTPGVHAVKYVWSGTWVRVQ